MKEKEGIDERKRRDANLIVHRGLLLNLRGTPRFWPAEQRKRGL